jgi:signal transduction histidine kinase
MRHYSLRWKLVMWAALFALSASIICLWTTWILVRAQEIQALDRRLVTDAGELFRDIENFQGANKRRDLTERYVPLALRDRLVEVRGFDGDILYMSPNLSEPVLKNGIETFHTREIAGKPVRIGVFRDEELTLHVGADFADTGRLALRATEFDLRKLLEGSLEDARILGARSNLQIETSIPETLPMSGDREMISLTVQNLVENAVKYNRTGGKIVVSAEKHDHVVQICVGNNGPGIPPERVPRVFERFYRARGDEQTPGHGLGLSIARELARAHGGDLTLAMSREDWTEFRLRLSASSVHL